MYTFPLLSETCTFAKNVCLRNSVRSSGSNRISVCQYTVIGSVESTRYLPMIMSATSSPSTRSTVTLPAT